MVRVAALQFDVRADDWAANLGAVRLGLEEAGARGIELVVLPEMWPTSFPLAVDEEALELSRAHLASLCELSETLALVVCGSAFGRGREPHPAQWSDGLPANRLHAFDRGRHVLSYDKVHLFTPTAEEESFSAGGAPPATAETSVGLLSGAICYDLRFPEVLRVPFRAGAEIVCVPAQWPSARAAHWRALAVARAIENQCFLVACNRTGRSVVGRRRLELAFAGGSLIVSPQGEVLAEGGGAPQLVEAEIDLRTVRSSRARVPARKDQRPELYARWLRDELAEPEGARGTRG